MPYTIRNRDTLLIQRMQIDQAGELYKIKRYDLVQFLALLGGLLFFVSRAIHYLISPLQAHSFKMQALKNLYYARTSRRDLFTERDV